MTDSEEPAAPAEEPDAFAPPPFAAPQQPGGAPGAPGPAGQAWPGAVPPQYGPPPGYPPYPYGYVPGYPYLRPQSGTNGLAIAAMICGICGFLCGVPAVIGIILGIVSLPQIKQTQQSGRGMAIAGIVTGSLWILLFVLLFAFGHDSSGQNVNVN